MFPTQTSLRALARGRRRATACLLAAGLVALVAGRLDARRQADGAPPAPPTVVVVEYDGIIHPIATEVFDDAITRAERTAASACVIVLRTPGGLLDATQSITSRMLAAAVPVVVFVAPGGARAASAGFLILLAADIAAMAPGTHVGAAHPVGANGQDAGSDTMNEKVAQDTAAYARSLAETHGRNVELATAAVVESRAFTDREALEATPPLIDLTATDVADLLRQLDGRTITRGGRTMAIRTAGAIVDPVIPTMRQRLLSAIAHPQIAYLLLSLGMLGLVVELWNPGAVLPGVAGGLCLLLAFFAFQVLPVNAAGFLLILFGLGLLALELKVPSFGALGIGGTIALLLGSVMITREVPGVSVSLGIIVPVVAALAGILLFLGRLAVHAQRRTASTGVEGMVGATAEVLTRLDAGRPGQVRAHGEIWSAVSATDIPAGSIVRITSLNGLTLRVVLEGPQGRQADHT